MPKFYYEIQTPHAPGCSWLRSIYGRDTFERAAEEGLQFVQFHHRNGIKCAMRIHEENSDD